MISNKTILIPGSSPISLLYSLLCAQFGLKVILLGKSPYGGAWQKTDQNRIDPRIPVSTHILMHSEGLQRLLSEIQYKAAPWQLDPLEIDEKGTVLGNFAVSDTGLSIGNVSGKTDLLEFLKSQVNCQENISFQSKWADKITIGNSVDISCSDGSRVSGDGLIISSGIICDMFLNGKKINASTKCYDVITLRIIFSKRDFLPETFLHFKGKGSLIRELQVLKIENKCVLLAKLGRVAKTAKAFDIEQNLHWLVKKYFEVKINNQQIKYFKYENSRRYFDIPKPEYAKAPMIIPARIFSDDKAEENLISQDISKSFLDLTTVKNTILQKLT
ncbi:MAG: hypothetical protein VX167_01670 [Pseudomonadota bacterium]|nr:hypothetical protein [Pseudomonadota bacterium]